jgi:hypothetical protein
MQQQFTVNAFLARYRFWVTALIVFHYALMAAWAYNSATMYFDTCNQRASTLEDSLDFWLIWGTALGLLVPAAVYFLLYHVIYGFAYWIVWIFCLLFSIWHFVCGFWYISWDINCSSFPQCYGCQTLPTAPPANTTTTVPMEEIEETANFIFNWVCVFIFAVVCLIYLLLITALRSYTEFGLFWYMAAEMRVNNNVAQLPSPMFPTSAMSGAPGFAGSTEQAFQVWLATYRFWAGVPVFINLCCTAVLWWNFGNLLIGICHGMSWWGWQFISLFGTVWAVVGLFASVWILYNIIFGLHYILAFLGCLASGLWLTICFVMACYYGSNCISYTWCSGCAGGSSADWAYILHWVLVGVCMACNYIALITVYVLRTHTEWQRMIELAKQSDNPFIAQIVAPNNYYAGWPAWLGGTPMQATTGAGAYVATPMSASIGSSMPADASLSPTAPLVSRQHGAGKNVVIGSHIAEAAQQQQQQQHPESSSNIISMTAFIASTYGVLPNGTRRRAVQKDTFA